MPRKGWIEREPHRKISVGDFVENFGEIMFRCIKNFDIEASANNVSTCVNGQWSSPGVPDCYAVCSPKDITGLSIRPTNCIWNDRKVECTKPAGQGTIAHIQCREGYKRGGPKDQVISCSKHGKWSPEPRKCLPVCGELPKPKMDRKLFAVAEAATVIPWHVGIYKAVGDSYALECGGTIVSERAVISAAHCFWDGESLRLQQLSMFRVVAGYGATNYEAIVDPRARTKAKVQLFELRKILTAGSVTEYYDSDIAMLLLKTNIKFKPHIAPVCLPAGLSDEHPVGNVGILPGYGFYNGGASTGTNLQTIELSVLHKEQCLASTSALFRPYATQHYKYCTVYGNSGMRICHGAFGGGLVFPHEENGKQKFYLRGVASRGPSIDGFCDSDIYALFINNVFFHEYFASNGGGWAFSHVLKKTEE